MEQALGRVAIESHVGGWLYYSPELKEDSIKKLFFVAILSGVMVSAAWALFETNKDLISTAKITMEEAVRAAGKAVPGGKVVKAELGKEDGRTVYEIEVIDANTKAQKVYVDAQTGTAKVNK